jgi:sterol desaturase/sphingolipid hydroxylase (fatty acid hydroxylase superfamily)
MRFEWLTPLVAASCLTLLTLLEVRRPLRPASEPRWRRIGRNLFTGGLAQAVAGPARAFLVLPLAVLVEQRGWGLLNLLSLPAWASLTLGLLALDYTLWHWHRLNHRVPILWRFHSAHHADLEMDASTALRFHFGEVALGIGWMALQVVVLGIRPMTLAVFSSVLMASVLFHHSNVRLPERFERGLVKLVAMPRMHGIHHSVVPAETNSNYASLLTAWDVLHGTLRLDVRQEAITIGVREWRDPRELTLLGVQILPFRKRRTAALDGP